MNTLKNRFIKKIDFGSDCWLWKGCVNRQTYGLIKVKHMGSQLSHRISYLLFVGAIPLGQDVLHKCDTPRCVRPDHLFLGTARDNSRDMILKDRSVGKFTVKQIRALRSRFLKKTTREELTRLSREYGVNRVTMWRIYSKKTWSMV